MRKTHGDSQSRLYRIWQRQKAKHNDKRNVHGRNDFHFEWRFDYAAFKAWALSNGYTETSTLMRRSKYVGYTPDNAYWEDAKRNKPDDLVNRTFGRLTVLREVPLYDRKPGRRTYICRCSCGNETTVQAHNLLSGQTRSCGCARFQLSTHPLYGWDNF